MIRSTTGLDSYLVRLQEVGGIGEQEECRSKIQSRIRNECAGIGVGHNGFSDGRRCPEQ